MSYLTWNRFWQLILVYWRLLCLSLQLCKKKGSCFTCGDMMLNHATEALKILGGVGLFFSFTEVSVRSPNLYLLTIRSFNHSTSLICFWGTRERHLSLKFTWLTDVFIQVKFIVRSPQVQFSFFSEISVPILLFLLKTWSHQSLKWQKSTKSIHSNGIATVSGLCGTLFKINTQLT